ncbi:hypothetical protein GZH46_00727 [Fragariocoptes setiger]|uniref:Uncharacterized protein n=1 Tax=Fragariocoptes setiger TaxID=1670756 RepID=A0ABQ7SBD7_9ACAR|nr:hypothetical protein GZH46_00727 [Fragariocoptes setiger]
MFGFNSNRLVSQVLLVCAVVQLLHQSGGDAFPAFISRMSESIMGTSSAPAAQSQPQHSSALAPNVSSAAVPQVSDGSGSSSSSQQPIAEQVQANKMISGLQAQLSQFNAQKALQNLAAGSSSQANSANNNKFHMLEVLQNMGKAIQQQLFSSNNNIQIITSPASPNANIKKNEYQHVSNSAPGTDGQQKQTPTGVQPGMSYREQGEILRHEILRRAGQLQTVLASSMDIMKDKSDMIVRRLLESLNTRIDQAKSKADRIINEPATNEMAVKTLNTINQGLNQLNNIITNIVSRFDMTNNKDATQKIAAGLAAFNASPNQFVKSLTSAQQLPTSQQTSSVPIGAKQQ